MGATKKDGTEEIFQIHLKQMKIQFKTMNKVTMKIFSLKKTNNSYTTIQVKIK